MNQYTECSNMSDSAVTYCHHFHRVRSLAENAVAEDCGRSASGSGMTTLGTILDD